MKKIICVLLVNVIVFFMIPSVAFANTTEMKLRDVTIVVSENALATEEYAAERLEYYIEKIVSSDITVKKDNADVTGVVISVGHTVYSNTDFSSVADGSYVILSEKDLIIIDGAGNKGTINGVYAFLEKICGCHWYEDKVIVIPEDAEFTVPSGINIEFTPFFEYTETDTTSSRDAEFSIANGLTGGVYRDLTDEQGSDVSYIGSFCHTLVNYYCKPAKYFDEHPEYYALRDGVRTATQLCLTNEDVKDIVTREAIELLEEKHNPSAPLQILSLTQADNGEYCQCENCAALDDANGSQAGTMITFINEIASRISELGIYDNVAFDTFAYQYTRKAPTNVIPRDDVIVRLCSIECCFGHTLDDETCEDNVEFMEDLRAWNEICDRIYIWDYILNCYESVVIHPNFGVLQRNIQIFYEHGVKGIYEEGVFYISECDGEFGEMKTYLLSKLMQDPYLDYDAEMLGYLNAVYGPGGKYLKEFIDITIAHAVTPTSHLYIEMESYLVMNTLLPCDVKRCDELWEKAKSLAETEEQSAQLFRSEICWRYWKCAHYYSEFSLFQHPYLRMSANQKLYEDMIALGITKMGERANHEISHNACLRYFRHITTWITLYEEPIWDTLEPVALFIYEVAEKMYFLTHWFSM